MPHAYRRGDFVRLVPQPDNPRRRLFEEDCAGVVAQVIEPRPEDRRPTLYRVLWAGDTDPEQEIPYTAEELRPADPAVHFSRRLTVICPACDGPAALVRPWDPIARRYRDPIPECHPCR